MSRTDIHTAYLLTGSNLGDRKDFLDKAAALIDEAAGNVVRRSSYYETAAWGKTDQPAFLNQALQVETALNAKQLIRRLLKIEKQIGRIRKEKYGPRVIDIDLLFYDQERFNYPFLRLPHPEVQNRRFALIPLAEIAPDLEHPVLHRSVSSLLATCPDPLPVRQWP